MFYDGSVAMTNASSSISAGDAAMDVSAHRHLSSAGLTCLVLLMFMTGLGGTAGLGASVNTVAKSFPDHSVSGGGWRRF
jgi:hypothetical protein